MSSHNAPSSSDPDRTPPPAPPETTTKSERLESLMQHWKLSARGEFSKGLEQLRLGKLDGIPGPMTERDEHIYRAAYAASWAHAMRLVKMVEAVVAPVSSGEADEGEDGDDDGDDDGDNMAHASPKGRKPSPRTQPSRQISLDPGSQL